MIHFLHPAFLYGLFVLAIPIILHLFSFKRYKKVYFSNFNFLASLQQQKKNSSKLKNLLLLLLRLIILATIVIAFASPYIIPSNKKRHNDTKRSVILYIDNSFSMSNTGTKGSLLEEAKKHLFDIAGSYPAGTNFTLLTNNNFQTNFLTKEEIQATLAGLKTTAASRTLSDIFKEAGETSFHKPATLFIISDFQKKNCDFQNVKADSLLEPVFLVLKPENINNLYIKEVSFEQAFHKKNQTDKITIKVANSSDKEFNNVPVSLTINNKKKSINKINITANGEETIEINYLNTEDGFHKGIAEINDFPVIFDNKFYFSYATGGKVNILCIDQEKHSPFFQKLFADSTAFSLTFTNVNQTANINFSNYNLVILDQISNSWTGLESALETYVEEGGNLFVLPGQKKSAGTLNQILQKMHAPLFGNLDTNAVISHIETQAALFKDVFEKQEDNIVLPRAKQFYHLANDEKAEQLLRDKRGYTLLAAQNTGQGNIYISAFNYDPDNSDMVYHPLFIPIMVNMACNVNSEMNTSYFLGSDKPVKINGKTIPETSGLKITNDEHSLEFIPGIRKDFSGNLIVTNTSNITDAGLYDVIQDGQIIDVLAYNYDREESQLQFSNEDEIQKYFPQAKVENIKTSQLDHNSELVKEIVLQDNNKYISGWFLLLAVIALLFEQVVWRRKLM